jgi:ribosome-binding protein aMBF1 (putative translation factor)
MREAWKIRMIEADREVYEDFGAWLVACRRDLGLSQAALGFRVGLHQSTVSRLEHGRLPYLRFRTVARLVVIMLDTLARTPRGNASPPRIR